MGNLDQPSIKTPVKRTRTMNFLKALIFLTPAVSGILFQPPLATNEELKLADALRTVPLSVQLDIGAAGSLSRLNVNAMDFELSSAHADYPHTPLPGTDGPRPHISCGARTLDVINEGYYIDMKGMQHVKTLNGVWEMVWKEDSDEGKLICGFDVPTEYRRNDALIPQSRLYLSFPLWTSSSWESAKIRREKILKEAKRLDSHHDEEMEKMNSTTNPIMKALHYRNAAAALVEKNQVNPIKTLKKVPSEDDLFSISEDLLLSKKGLVVSRKSSHNNILLGTCSCKLTSDESKR